jgi:hypothetical protein
MITQPAPPVQDDHGNPVLRARRSRPDCKRPHATWPSGDRRARHEDNSASHHDYSAHHPTPGCPGHQPRDTTPVIGTNHHQRTYRRAIYSDPLSASTQASRETAQLHPSLPGSSSASRSCSAETRFADPTSVSAALSADLVCAELGEAGKVAVPSVLPMQSLTPILPSNPSPSGHHG